MPTFLVTAPDGRKLKITGPEGSTKEDAIAQAKKAMETPSSAQTPSRDQGYIPENPGVKDFARTALDQGLQGATFGFSDEISDRVGALIASQVTGIPYKDMLKEARETTKARLSEQQSEMPVTSIAANIAGGLATGVGAGTTKAGTAAGNIIRSGNAPARIAKGIGAGAASGAAYGAGTAQEGERLEGAGAGALVGGVVGGAVPAVAAAGRGVKNAIIPQIDEAIKPLVQRARDFGIPLRADQVAPTKIRRTVQKVSQELPGSGADAFEDTQRKAWVKGVASTIGEEAEDVGPETINRFIDRNSSSFERLVGDRPIPVDLKDVNAISRLRNSVDNTLGITSRDSKILKAEIKAVSEQLSDGPLTGQKIANIRSDLLKKSTGAGPGKQIFSDLIEKIDTITKKSLDDAGKAELAAARLQYRNFKTLEPLLEESTDGSIDPVKLMDRVKSSKFIKASRKNVGEDDLVDLARIGKRFLPKQGGSDTFQKSAIAGGVGAIGLTAVSNPLLALGLGAKVGAGLAANRGLQKTVSSQKLIDLALKTPKQAKKLPNVPLNALVAGQSAIE